jgi:hypothetical protein
MKSAIARCIYITVIGLVSAMLFTLGVVCNDEILLLPGGILAIVGVFMNNI